MPPPPAMNGDQVTDDDAPPDFLCPISLQIMRDPVTLATGITYDRDSIERWFSSAQHKERPATYYCPVTKQAVAVDADLTPNHTLRRLIQAWCEARISSLGVEQFPTPRPVPLGNNEIAELLRRSGETTSKSQLAASLRKLRDVVNRSERGRRCAVAAGALDFLLSVVRSTNAAAPSAEAHVDPENYDACSMEALCLLHSLHVDHPETVVAQLMVRNGDLVQLLTSFLKRGGGDSRACATLLLKPILTAPNYQLALLKEEEEDLSVELVKVARDHISDEVTEAALRVLAGRLCRSENNNRVKAAEAGGVAVVLNLLNSEEQPEKRICEAALLVLAGLCGCAEGRMELLGHGAWLLLVSRQLFEVSPLATELSVAVIHAVVSRSSATAAVLEEMAQVGIVSKLFLLLQLDCGSKTRKKANDILRLHLGSWKNYPRTPLELLDWSVIPLARR